MKITVHCEGTAAEVAKQLAEVAATLAVAGKVKGSAVAAGDDAEEKSDISVADLKEGAKKRGRPPGSKNKAKVEEVEEDEAEEDSVDAEDADDESEDFEDSDDADEEEAEDDGLSEAELTKLKAALKAYSAKHGKEKAVKVLHKFAKASQDVPKDKLPALLKLLKV